MRSTTRISEKNDDEARAQEAAGDFYSNQNARVGEVFATEVIRAAKDGRLSFRAAYDLTGLRDGTFQAYAARLGIDLP